MSLQSSVNRAPLASGAKRSCPMFHVAQLTKCLVWTAAGIAGAAEKFLLAELA